MIVPKPRGKNSSVVTVGPVDPVLGVFVGDTEARGENQPSSKLYVLLRSILSGSLEIHDSTHQT